MLSTKWDCFFRVTASRLFSVDRMFMLVYLRHSVGGFQVVRIYEMGVSFTRLQPVLCLCSFVCLW